MPDFSVDSAPTQTTGRVIVDGGPIYTETDTSRFVAEPFNAASAFLFFLMAASWGWKLRKRYREYPFLASCVAVLAIGGVGGTLFHGLRTSPLFYLMDVVPIGFLAASVGLYFWKSALHSWWAPPLALAPFLLVRHVLGRLFTGHTLINISYGVLACLVVVPILVCLSQRKWREFRIVAISVGLFAGAIFFRMIDTRVGAYLPMGTHWLWHTLSAIAVQFLALFIFRYEGFVRRTGTAHPHGTSDEGSSRPSAAG